MEYNIRKTGEYAIIDVVGSLKTEDDYETFKKGIQEVLDSGDKNIILNFENMLFINSSGLGKLILTAKKTAESGGSLKVINLSDDLKDLFNFTRLSEKINIFDSEQEAMAN